MYTWFYGFSEEPFNASPDPKFFYPTTTHRQALDTITRRIQERREFIVLLGELGSGKTTLIQHLVNTLDPKNKAVALFHPPATIEELFADTLRELGVSSIPQDKASLARELNGYLCDLAPDETLTLIIDEAHDLSPGVMDELRLFPTPETPDQNNLQILFVGQPELEALLGSKDLSELRRKIEVLGCIQPLNEEECQLYIAHRVRQAGSDIGKVFTPEALSLICQHAKGNLRKINILCDNSFLIGYGLAKKRVDSAIIMEVLEDLDFSGEEDRSDWKTMEILDHRVLEERARGSLFKKIAYSLFALIGVAAIILLGRIFLKSPEEGQAPKFPIQSPALQEKGAPPSPEIKPDLMAKAIPKPDADIKPSSPVLEREHRLPVSPPGKEEKSATPTPTAIKKAEDPIPLKAPVSQPPSKESKPGVEPAGKPPAPAPEPEPKKFVSKRMPSPPAPSQKGEIPVKKTVAVKAGDSIYAIAAQNYQSANTSIVEQILEANPKVTNPNKLVSKQSIRLPEITEESLIIESGDGTYKVRLGTFLKPEYSTFLKGEPALKGKQIEIIPRKLPTGETWYRAVAGKFRTQGEAAKLLRDLKDRGLSPYFVGFRKKGA
jgi:type II secretory pathway predicted ATPase ExeA/phage tail protein X